MFVCYVEMCCRYILLVVFVSSTYSTLYTGLIAILSLLNGSDVLVMYTATLLSVLHAEHFTRNVEMKSR